MAIKYGFSPTPTNETAELVPNLIHPYRLAVYNASSEVKIFPTGDTNSYFTIPANTVTDVGVVILGQLTIGFTAGTTQWWADPV